ncbi:hypothetical protein Scep_017264 [Stephania cephalantha]|uniref:Uncharacterized protein n=1 Tax=Stephania cephalantha TaxID=152367 RepID=A0AAP0NWR3_9MAGN
MAVTFTNLHNESVLKSLVKFLSSKSYISASHHLENGSNSFPAYPIILWVKLQFQMIPYFSVP